jgi:hypothetical protein
MGEVKSMDFQAVARKPVFAIRSSGFDIRPLAYD